MTEKYGVMEEDEAAIQQAIKTKVCPTCGRPLDIVMNQLKCPECGTRPFEKKKKLHALDR